MGTASELIARTRSNLQLDCVPALGYNSGGQAQDTAPGNLPRAPSPLGKGTPLLEDTVSKKD